jgi:hypothetical protein
MTDVVEHGSVLEFDPQAAQIGLALLQLQASASDPRSQPGWVHRRVQQLEFLDTRAVRWRVSVDFVVPEDTPELVLGDRQFRLVPVTSMAKTDLVAFSLRDENAAAIWMPTSNETSRYLAPALVYWASQDLGLEPTQLPALLAQDISRIVSERRKQLESRPPVLLLAAGLIDAKRRHARAKTRLAEIQATIALVPRWKLVQRLRLRAERSRARRELDTARGARQSAEQKLHAEAPDTWPLAYRLMASANFRSRVEELAQNFVVHVGASTPPGSRRIIKLSYESEITFARPRGRIHRLWQSLGWRCWQVDVLIGGNGGSSHLEVTAPAGVDVVGVTAEPVPDGREVQISAHRSPGQRLWAIWRSVTTMKWWRGLIFWQPEATFSVDGYVPHVHINPPGAAVRRFRAAIFVRVSRPGWLTASWLVAVVIGGVILIGRLNLQTVYSRTTTGEAGTAATLLLALLGVIATMLVRPGEHPLASRLLLMARLLIVVQVGVVLAGVGNLVLHRLKHQVPMTLWTWLAVVAATTAILFTVSWAVPVALRPNRELSE